MYHAVVLDFDVYTDYIHIHVDLALDGAIIHTYYFKKKRNK